MGTIHPPNNLRNLRLKAGLTETEVGEKLGMSEAGYRKLERRERGLKADRIAKAAEIFGVTVSEIMASEIQAENGSQKPANPQSALKPANRGFAYKPVVGTLAAGIFRDAELFDDELDEMISTPPNSRYPWARQKVWRVEGDSMNRAEPKPINDGDYVVGIMYEDIQEAVQLKTGLNVVIRRTSNNWQTIEKTVKQLVLFDDRTEFQPCSTNEKHRPIVVKRDLTADDGTIVEIEALVQFVFDSHEQLF